MEIVPQPEDLQKTHPNLAKIWPFFMSVMQESERGTVLITSGYIEQQLEEILRAFMVADLDVDELLQGANAPVGTLAARISICHGLGLIADDEKRELTFIRKIRNEFAHHVETTFATSRVSDWCKELKIRVPAYIRPEGPESDSRPQTLFLTAAMAIMMWLVNRPEHVSLQRRSAQAWAF
jgi:hypothetical protein